MITPTKTETAARNVAQERTPYVVEKNHLGYWCVFKGGNQFSNAFDSKHRAETIAERFNDAAVSKAKAKAKSKAEGSV